MTRKARKKAAESTEDWRRYERAMFNDLYYVYRPPQFVVLPDARVIEGLISKGKRQIDVVVLHRDNMSRPFLTVESKFYKRKVDIKHVEAFIGMEQELGSQQAIMVSPNGFTDMAHRRVRGTNIQLLTLPQDEADRLNWREIARQYFTLDESNHPEMGDSIHIFNTTNAYDDLVSIMEQLPFEEWEELFRIYGRVNTQRCKTTLEELSLSHHDADWVFNTVRMLDEFGWLDEDTLDKLADMTCGNT